VSVRRRVMVRPGVLRYDRNAQRRLKMSRAIISRFGNFLAQPGVRTLLSSGERPERIAAEEGHVSGTSTLTETPT
jgi:hypothetical protein